MWWRCRCIPLKNWFGIQIWFLKSTTQAGGNWSFKKEKEHEHDENNELQLGRKGIKQKCMEWWKVSKKRSLGPLLKVTIPWRCPSWICSSWPSTWPGRVCETDPTRKLKNSFFSFRILFTRGVFRTFDAADSQDYLLRNFNLFRLESTHEIRDDLQDQIPRWIFFREYNQMTKGTIYTIITVYSMALWWNKRADTRELFVKGQNCSVSGQDESITRSGCRNLLFGVSENGCTVGRIGSNERFLDQICKLRASTWIILLILPVCDSQVP